MDAIFPLLFFIISCILLSLSRRNNRHLLNDNDCLRLPTAKTVSVFRRSLILLIITLLEISSWAFIFAWRLESVILERSRAPNNLISSNNKIPPLYQIIDPSLAFIPRVNNNCNLTVFSIFLIICCIDLHTNLNYQIIYNTCQSLRSFKIHQIQISFLSVLFT